MHASCVLAIDTLASINFNQYQYIVSIYLALVCRISNGPCIHHSMYHKTRGNVGAFTNTLYSHCIVSTQA